MPEALRWSWGVTDPAALSAALAEEVDWLEGTPIDQGAPLAAQLEAAGAAMRGRHRERHLVEVGIGCEACHNGGRQHAASPYVISPSFTPELPFLEAQPLTPTRTAAINRVCTQCHSVLFSRYPHTWEGGARGTPSEGGSTTNSGEGRDFLLGGCASQLRCTDCHDPHRHDDPTASARLDSPVGNPVCTRCHPAFEESDALQAHTRHAPDSAGSACAACHLPRQNIGLRAELTRYHRIGSPNAPERLTGDRPGACALCHADLTGGALADALEAGWPTRVDRDRLAALYGGLHTNLLMSTATRGRPHEQVVAAHALADAGRADAIPALRELVAHPYPQVRFHAERALERLIGTPSPLDVHADPDVIRAAAQTWGP